MKERCRGPEFAASQRVEQLALDRLQLVHPDRHQLPNHLRRERRLRRPQCAGMLLELDRMEHPTAL